MAVPVLDEIVRESMKSNAAVDAAIKRLKDGNSIHQNIKDTKQVLARQQMESLPLTMPSF